MNHGPGSGREGKPGSGTLPRTTPDSVPGIGEIRGAAGAVSVANSCDFAMRGPHLRGLFGPSPPERSAHRRGRTKPGFASVSCSIPKPFQTGAVPYRGRSRPSLVRRRLLPERSSCPEDREAGPSLPASDCQYLFASIHGPFSGTAFQDLLFRGKVPGPAGFSAISGEFQLQTLGGGPGESVDVRETASRLPISRIVAAPQKQPGGSSGCHPSCARPPCIIIPSKLMKSGRWRNRMPGDAK